MSYATAMTVDTMSLLTASFPTTEELLQMENSIGTAYCVACHEHFDGPQEISDISGECLCAMCKLLEEGYEL